MNIEKDTIIGIVGGMGPESGIALMNSILAHTQARTDQEHLSVILMSFPKHIVDRTAFLDGAVAVNPAFAIARVIGMLEKAGAKLAGIACNTTHTREIFDAILQELQKMQSNIQLVNMALETCLFIKNNYPQARRVGVMCTNGTFRSGVYTNLLHDMGYEVIMPDFRFQNDVVHNMIYNTGYGIKSNPGHISTEVTALFNKAVDFFRQQQVDALILGCTELSLAFKTTSTGNLIVVDAMDTLARALIREANAMDVNKTTVLPAYV
jgi:aspartate racemase